MDQKKYLICALDLDSGIGKCNKLPWYFPDEIKYFKKVTSTCNMSTCITSTCVDKVDKVMCNAVIMGKNTFWSIPFNYRPLKDRLNLVISNKITNNSENSFKLIIQNLKRFKESNYEDCEILEACVIYHERVKMSFSDYVKSVIGKTYYVNHIGLAIYFCSMLNFIENIFFIGGHQIYKEVLQSTCISALYLTKINNTYDCDKHFPLNWETINNEFICVPIGSTEGTESTESTESTDSTESIDSAIKVEYLKCFPKFGINNILSLNYHKMELCKINPEFEYLCLLEKVLYNGKLTKTRNGNTLRLFGEQITINMNNCINNSNENLSNDENFNYYRFPLLTTKRTYWKGIIEELLWFLKGHTDANELSEKGVHIWDGNGSREFLDSRGLINNKPGDLGPVYGYQWRNFGKSYDGESNDGSTTQPSLNSPGVDQVVELIRLIREDPTSRRMVVSAWNPIDLDKMALPPCHMFFQIFVNDGTLDLHMYQRSVDMFLGEPFNIASYYLLLCIICTYTDKKPGNIIISMGDTHIYEEHIEQVKIQLQRIPKTFPILKVSKSLPDLENCEKLENVIDQFEILNYKCHPGIKANMIV
jgi:dihydrofolate reductase/thymidylate synthase